MFLGGRTVKLLGCLLQNPAYLTNSFFKVPVDGAAYNFRRKDILPFRLERHLLAKFGTTVVILFLFSFSGWLGATSYFISLTFSPLIIGLCRQKSTRLIAVIGGLFAALGCLFTSFSTQFHQLFFSYGIFVGKYWSVESPDGFRELLTILSGVWCAFFLERKDHLIVKTNITEPFQVDPFITKIEIQIYCRLGCGYGPRFSDPDGRAVFQTQTGSCRGRSCVRKWGRPCSNVYLCQRTDQVKKKSCSK